MRKLSNWMMNESFLLSSSERWIRGCPRMGVPLHLQRPTAAACWLVSLAVAFSPTRVLHGCTALTGAPPRFCDEGPLGPWGLAEQARRGKAGFRPSMNGQVRNLMSTLSMIWSEHSKPEEERPKKGNIYFLARLKSRNMTCPERNHLLEKEFLVLPFLF